MTHNAHPTPAFIAEAAAGSAPTIRNAQGQFAGTDVVPSPHPVPVTRFASLEEVGRTIDETVYTMLADAAAHDPKSKEQAPALALAPSPGSGKSTRTQTLLASQPRNFIGGDALFLSPTTDLSAEACDRALAIEGNATLATQIRGRASLDPEDAADKLVQDIKRKHRKQYSAGNLRNERQETLGLMAAPDAARDPRGRFCRTDAPLRKQQQQEM